MFEIPRLRARSWEPVGSAQPLRQKPGLDLETDSQGRPRITERLYVIPPSSQLGTPTPAPAPDAEGGLGGGRRLREDAEARLGLREAQAPRSLQPALELAAHAAEEVRQRLLGPQARRGVAADLAASQKVASSAISASAPGMSPALNAGASIASTLSARQWPGRPHAGTAAGPRPPVRHQVHFGGEEPLAGILPLAVLLGLNARCMSSRAMTGKGLWCTKHSKTASRLLSVAPRSAAALYDRYLSCRPTRQGATFITCPPQVWAAVGAAAPKPRARTQAAGLLERQPAPRRAHCAGARCRSGLASASRGASWRETRAAGRAVGSYPASEA